MARGPEGRRHFADIRGQRDAFEINAAVCPLPEDHLCNGSEMVPLEDIGALTAAPILCDDILRDDQGRVVEVGRVYWPDYAVRDDRGTPNEARDRVLRRFVGSPFFPIPARYTPDTTDMLPPEEVEPWVQTILRLWADAVFYRQQSEQALRSSQRFHPDRLRRLYTDFFRDLHPQPSPPIVLNPAPSSP